MNVRNKSLALTAATIWAVTLSGCAAGGGGTPSASPTPTPSATAAALPGAPEPVLDLSCGDLAAAADLTAMFGTAYAERTGAAWTDAALRVSPTDFAVQSAGGIACSWGNDIPRSTSSGSANAASDRLWVTVLPGVTAPQWAKYSDLYPQDEPGATFGDGSGTGCFADPGICTMNVLVGDVWLDVDASGVDTPAGATDADLLARVSPVVERMVDTIRAADVTGRQAPPAPAFDPALCEALLSGDWQHPAGGWSLFSSAAERAGVAACLPGDLTETGVAAAELGLLPGGAWAFADTVAETGVALDAELVTVAGTSASASYLRCSTPGTGAEASGTLDPCTVDLAVGADWLRVTLPTDDNSPWYAGKPDDLLDLAAEVVQNATR